LKLMRIESLLMVSALFEIQSFEFQVSSFEFMIRF
jgi:hypothetical protein